MRLNVRMTTSGVLAAVGLVSGLVLASPDVFALGVEWPGAATLRNAPAVVPAPLPDRSLHPAYGQVFSPDSEPYGSSYEQWLVRGMQYTWSIPTAYSPLANLADNNCAIAQTDPVWFLGISGSVPGTHRCLIPQGVAIMVGHARVNINVPNVCGQVGSFSTRELQAQLAALVDTATNVSITVDGATVPNVANRFRVNTPAFSAAFAKEQVGNAFCPPDDPVPPGVYNTVSQGFAVILKPLRPGPHEVKVHVEFPGLFTFDDTYQIDVVPVNRH